VGWFQSVSPLAILALAPPLTLVWGWLAKRNAEPSIPRKFGLGLIFNGLGFAVLMFALSKLLGPAGLIPFWPLAACYVLQTTGELCLSPVGLSAMNRLAPRYMASLIMGAWFFATAGGEFVAGKIGEAIGGEGGEMTREASLAMYDKIGWIGVGLGVAVLVVAPLVKRLMHLDTLRDDDVGDDLLGQGEAGEPQIAGVHPQTRD
jgi:POT family proton-dependent oligopeptide transporter